MITVAEALSRKECITQEIKDIVSVWGCREQDTDKGFDFYNDVKKLEELRREFNKLAKAIIKSDSETIISVDGEEMSVVDALQRYNSDCCVVLFGNDSYLDTHANSLELQKYIANSIYQKMQGTLSCNDLGIGFPIGCKQPMNLESEPRLKDIKRKYSEELKHISTYTIRLKSAIRASNEKTEINL